MNFHKGLICPFCTLIKSQSMYFSVWLLLLNILFMKFSCIIASKCKFVHSSYCIIFHCHILITHSIADRHVGCFYSRSVRDNASMNNLDIPTVERMYVLLLGLKPGKQFVMCMVDVSRHCQTVFQRACVNLHSHQQQCIKRPPCSTFQPTILLFFLLGICR